MARSNQTGSHYWTAPKTTYWYNVCPVYIKTQTISEINSSIETRSICNKIWTNGQTRQCFPKENRALYFVAL